MAAAYYNEIDPKAAAWLRELIAQGHIAPGTVDERDIQDVRPDELVGFTQCHFFAGIGGWSYALRLAGWPDDRPVWTGSCPCQPFSAAGKRAGFADERHLWPAWFWLIEQRRPGVVFGEQVASPDGLKWFDLVSTDMEGAGYACAAFDLGAAGVGAPNIRQRLWFMAVSQRAELHRYWPVQDGPQGGPANSGGLGIPGGKGLARPSRQSGDDAAQCPPVERAGGQLGDLGHTKGRGFGIDGSAPGNAGHADQPSAIDGLVNPNPKRRDGQRLHVRPGRPLQDQVEAARGGEVGPLEHAAKQQVGIPGLAWESRSPTSGYWRDAEWIYCTDGKWRPVEPGTFPLAHGVPARVGRLRGYGNAINPIAAQKFIEAVREIIG